MTGSTEKIQLSVNPEELAEIIEGLDQRVRDLSDNLEDCIDHNFEEGDDLVASLQSAQSAKCKLSIQANIQEAVPAQMFQV